MGYDSLVVMILDLNNAEVISSLPCETNCGEGSGITGETRPVAFSSSLSASTAAYPEGNPSCSTSASTGSGSYCTNNVQLMKYHYGADVLDVQESRDERKKRLKVERVAKYRQSHANQTEREK